MRWQLSNSCDPQARKLADDHYSRQKPGSMRFAPPGRCFVLLTICQKAYWVTSWPYAEYTKHAWAGAWVCSAFRNIGVSAVLSSELIRQAIACTLWNYKRAPELGMITFVDEGKVRRKRDPGRCFIKAGFKPVGYTQGGLRALQLLPEDMPNSQEPYNKMKALREQIWPLLEVA